MSSSEASDSEEDLFRYATKEDPPITLSSSSLLCPVCQCIPDSVWMPNSTLENQSPLQYQLQKNRPEDEDVRERWEEKCRLYRLVTYLESIYTWDENFKLDITPAQDRSIFTGRSGPLESCARRFVGVELTRGLADSSSEEDTAPRASVKFELCCNFDNPLASIIDDGLVDQNMLSSHSISRMQYWLRRCENNHPKCQTLTQSLPTRVLEVGDQTIRVVETKDERGHYVTLSHCWGTSPTFTTTKDTFASRKAGFELKELPRTFQDAIVLTRILGLRFLWIDSLCIIQGDTEDWEKEGSKMCDIYSNSFLTICASRAKSDAEGFLQGSTLGRSQPRSSRFPYISLALVAPKSASAFDTFNGGFEGAECPNITEVATVNLLRDFDQSSPFVRPPEHQPLDSRAWTFQERHLSPRKLHFTKQELIWECHSESLSENRNEEFFNIEDSVTKFVPEDRTDATYHTYRYWREAVSRFSERSLTYNSDKLPALAGFAVQIAQVRESRYCAGIWYDDLPWGLEWTASEFCSRPASWRGPSWSWISVNGFLSYRPDREPAHVPLECTSILDVHAPASVLNPYGEVRQAWLDVKAPLISLIHKAKDQSVKRRPFKGDPMVCECDSEFSHYTFSLAKDGSYQIRHRFDVAGEESTSIFALPLTYTFEYIASVIGPRKWFGLLVQETGDTGSSFKRVGNFELGMLERNEENQIIHDNPPQQKRLI
ncbi:heterokaryon incompatibility protein [Phlyctema vagabunda]|uniref:Heterokaryon incompatibility protein n=1 Tax=Phlyctema vagabunda TaxID=108571 RepID=A0ABR4P338_9HELO